jgi:ABC-2 type transport system ATP-binding protein
MIEVKHLTKRFGAKTAVDNVSFTVEKGEILGFLGPNGAGKSTSMRMITGFLPPTRGTAVIGGDDIREAPIAARARMGYLPENAPVYPDMTVRGYLDFCAEIRGFTGEARKRRVAETVERCFLNGVEPQPIGTLSKGYRQRVCFAQSILHDPEYLIMDEPTDGLDPNQKYEVRQMIRRMSADKAIILSTHILDEVDAVCTRAIIISGGRVAVDDTPDHLRARSKIHGTLSLTLSSADPEAVLGRVRKVEGIREARLLESDDGLVKIRAFPAQSADPKIADRVIAALSDGGFELRTLFVERGRLDEVFRTITSAG